MLRLPRTEASEGSATSGAGTGTVRESTILSCQDQYFAGGYDCPFYSTSEAAVDVSKETMLWATGLLDNRDSQCEPQTQDPFYNLGFSAPEGYVWGEQMSSQIFANKQLQDTLVQKEEELARLHEENNKLKQYLSSTYVKGLEERAKKLLSQHGKKIRDVCRAGKRKAKESDCNTSLKKARRNLFTDFTASQEQTTSVNTWVLQTLGLKDVDTIDESSPVNYSALTSELVNTIEAYQGNLLEPMDYSASQDSHLGFDPAHRTPVHECESLPSGGESPYLHPCLSVDSNSTSSSHLDSYGSSPYYASDVSPNKTDIAFSTSLNPHRNVKTHTFAQGQAFVRRDDEGGWKFTWVPKQSD
ncbi:geminin coiled-coil domain-containing protein 1 isoform X2 [Pleurodeles waltl]|uniref:geminin coiled-coil domain-containing protein 1 isoform X2 n=1 Tax=Pleurodeles waltl TaxID=8319 RepID=UPI003709395E